MKPRYVILANPTSLRWQAYAPELESYWCEQGKQVEIELVPWCQVIGCEGKIEHLPAFCRPALVRLESPGRDWEVAKLLLEVGRRCTGEAGGFAHLEYQKGRLVRPGLLYLGFARILTELGRSFARLPHLTLTADPEEVAEMFDKNATSTRLRQAGIPTPTTLPLPVTAEELLTEIRRQEWATTYVKLNSGSSASAMVVLHALADPAWGRSSILRMNGEFWSTRRLQRYRGQDLEAVLSFLIEEGVSIQRGIPMAQIEGENFDLRVVMIQCRPAFTIFRLSSLPMTNLHLGGRRGNVQACRAAIPMRAWLDAMDHCVQVARLYRTQMIGIDLLFESGYRGHYVLEVNAFGDFFPKWTDESGRTVHRAEIEATAGHWK